MDMLENILSQGIVHKLGWTLLHSVWQGGVVVLLLVVCLRILQKYSANLRYVITCIGLVVIVLLTVATFYVVPAPTPMPDVESVPGFLASFTKKPYEVYDADMPLKRAAEYMQISHTISLKQRAMNYYTSVLPYIVLGWFIGVLALFIWHIGGFVRLLRLKRQKVSLVDESLKEKLLNLAGRLRIIRPVMLMESALVQIPTVVGWFRPVILLPASALSGLTPEQIRALLAHELAHIRRYDYLVNMFQTVVEILGFYHPAVWWVSHKIRVERENCCDDLAVSVCGDKVGYARALTSMEEVRFAKGKLAIASSGGSLSRRIRRLIGTDSAENKSLGYLPVVVSILLIMALTIPTTLAITNKRENKDSSPNSAIETGSIKATDAYVTATGQKNDYDPKYPAADSGKTAKKAQILFDCEIYELPADLKFIEDERRKGISGPIKKLLESLKSEREKGSAGISIQLGKEYADSLKALSRENEYVKVLASPKIMTLDEEEATVNTTQNVSYTADYETDEGDDKPKPIIKNLPCEMELKVKGEVAKNNTIFIHLRLTQSKPVFATKQNDEGHEIQIPIIERSDCTTYLDTRSGESIILGGLRSDEGSSRNLILVITPSIIRPEQDPVMLEQQARDLEQKAAELYQLQKDIQRQLEDLEQRKAELESLSSLLASAKEVEGGKEPGYHTVREGETLSSISKKYYGSENKWQRILDCNREIITADGIRVGQKLIIPPLLSSAKEAETEHERLAAMAAKFAERGDFVKAIEHLENAIELARAEKDYGIGIAIEKVDGLIRINQLLPDAPASGSSFRRGDIIKAIDGASTEGMSLNEVVAAIRGPKGTKVTLTVKSHSQDITMNETFTRQLLLKGSPALEEYKQRLAAYHAGKTWPQYYEMWRKYDDLLKDPNASKAGIPYIFELKYANPEELAELLNRILERRWEGIKDKPKDSIRIVPDPGHKKLIILASPADIRLLEALIAELDVLAKQDTTVLKALPDIEYEKYSAAGSTITRVIKLKYADCKDLEQILLQILSDKRLRIATDKRTNMLIVTGTESTIEEILALVAELDVPSREDNTATKINPSSKLTPDTSVENAFYEIIQLKYSDCERVSEKVEKNLSPDQQFQLVPFKDTNRLLILGTMSAIQQVKALAEEIDVPGSKKELEIAEP